MTSALSQPMHNAVSRHMIPPRSGVLQRSIFLFIGLPFDFLLGANRKKKVLGFCEAAGRF